MKTVICDIKILPRVLGIWNVSLKYGAHWNVSTGNLIDYVRDATSHTSLSHSGLSQRRKKIKVK